MLFLASGLGQMDVTAALDHVQSRHLTTPPVVDGLVLHEAHLVSQLQTSPVSLWIGGRFIAFTGPGTRYFEGMMNDNWRYSSVVECEAAAQQALSQVQPSQQAGWYITEEGDVTGMGANEQLRVRYEWYLVDLIKRLYALRMLPLSGHLGPQGR